MSRLLGVLTALDSGPVPTQRMLASRLQIALGTAHNLVCSLVQRNWVERIRSNGRTSYRLTPTGQRERFRLLRLQFGENVGQYARVRDRITERLEGLPGGNRTVVLYGAGDVAQIAYIVLANGPFQLTGVVDDHRWGENFFGFRIARPAVLREGRIDGHGFRTVAVASYANSRKMVASLRRMGLASVRILNLVG